MYCKKSQKQKSKQNTMKHLKHLFTALLLLCTTVATAHDFEVDGIYYDITYAPTKTVAVTYRGSYDYSYSNEYAGSVEIPESVTYDGTTYSVTSIGYYAFRGCSGLTSIEIPNSVTSIGGGAFQNCSGLTSVEIPNSVTSIGDWAFSDCSGLTSILIPNSITSIGGGEFAGCTGLTSITIPNSVTSIGSSAFSGCTGLTSIVVDGNNTKYDSRKNCNAIIETETNTLVFGCKNTVIPDEITSIGDYAFENCDCLTSIEIPNSVTSIGDYAFCGCTGLTSIEIPNSVTSIGDYAFCGCTVLTSIEIPSSVTSIGDYAFKYCSGLTSVEIPNSVTSIGEQAFRGCTGLTSITIPNSVTSIGDYAFENCTELKTVYNFSNLTFSKGSSEYGYVAYYATKVINAPNAVIDSNFIWCKLNGANTLACYLGEVAELTLPADYNGENYVIGNDALNGCTRLTSITIPNSVTSIGERVFFYCTGLTSITIPNSVTSIGNYAFNGCTSLKELRIEDGESTLSLGYNTYNSSNTTSKGLFYDCPLETLYLGRNLSYNTSSNYGYSPFYNIKTLANVTIGNSVTSIGEYAFYNCTGLTSVVIDNSVTSIGNSAFNGCTGLTSIEIPNSVTSIGASAFEGCNNIEKLYIGSSVESIGDKAFAGCEKITEIKVALEKPIRGSADIFTNAVYDNATLYIPNDTEQLYQKREPWNLFFYIAEMDFTGIDEVFDEVKGEPTVDASQNGKVEGVYYDLSGRAVENPSSGIYIINGKKVIIK